MRGRVHSWPRLGCAPVVPQWLVKAFAFHFDPTSPPTSSSRSSEQQPLFSRININATSCSLQGGFCSSSALNSRALLLPSTLNADAPRRLCARIRISQSLSLILFLFLCPRATVRAHLRSAMKYDLWMFPDIEFVRFWRKDEDKRLPFRQYLMTTSNLCGSLPLNDSNQFTNQKHTFGKTNSRIAYFTYG